MATQFKLKDGQSREFTFSNGDKVLFQGLTDNLHCRVIVFLDGQQSPHRPFVMNKHHTAVSRANALRFIKSACIGKHADWEDMDEHIYAEKKLSARAVLLLEEAQKAGAQGIPAPSYQTTDAKGRWYSPYAPALKALVRIGKLEKCLRGETVYYKMQGA